MNTSPDEGPLSSVILTMPQKDCRINIDNVFGTRKKPLEVDIGCGKGRLLLARAEADPEINFLGIDRVSSRIEKIARRAARRGLTNIRLLRADAFQAVESFLPLSSVSVFYIFFPDPWPKRRHFKRRLFTESFAHSLLRATHPGGRVHIATDHSDYFDLIEKIMENEGEFERIEPYIPSENERTNFEMVFLGINQTVNRCSFRKI